MSIANGNGSNTPAAWIRWSVGIVATAAVTLGVAGGACLLNHDRAIAASSVREEAMRQRVESVERSYTDAIARWEKRLDKFEDKLDRIGAKP